MNSIMCANLGLKASFYDQLLVQANVDNLCFKHQILRLLQQNLVDSVEIDFRQLLENIGFTQTIANKINKISKFSPINQFTFYDWIEFYIVMKIYSLTVVQIQENGTKTEWLSPTIEIFLSNKSYYFRDVKVVDLQSTYWYHGTTKIHAHNILYKGIEVKHNNVYKNFGPGFYLTNNPNLAFEYANFATNYFKQLRVAAVPSVLVFEVPKQENVLMLRRYQVKDLRSNDQEWLKVLNFFAFPDQSLPSVLGKSIKEFKHIEAIIGPQADLKVEKINKVFINKTDCLQLCIKRQKFAQEFLYLTKIYHFE